MNKKLLNEQEYQRQNRFQKALRQNAKLNFNQFKDIRCAYQLIKEQSRTQSGQRIQKLFHGNSSKLQCYGYQDAQNKRYKQMTEKKANKIVLKEFK